MRLTVFLAPVALITHFVVAATSNSALQAHAQAHTPGRLSNHTVVRLLHRDLLITSANFNSTLPACIMMSRHRRHHPP